MTSCDVFPLLSLTAPWSFRVVVSASELTNRLWALQRENSRLAVRFVRGKRMPTVEAMFDEFAAAFQFPYYFGANWDALDECLADLSWLPAEAYLATVLDSADFLSSEEQPVIALATRTLEEIAAEWSRAVSLGEPWDRPGKPFHVVFHCSPADAQRLPTNLAMLPELRL